MDLTPTLGLKRRLASPSSPAGVGEPARTLRRSPSSSLSPSSYPSSPLSSSSSVGAYQNHVKNQRAGFSTSATLTTPPTSLDFPRASMQSGGDRAEDGRRKMYDPFSPTDGDKERRGEVEGGEGEKYDPFDPTGSPASDEDNRSDKEWISKGDDDEEEEKDEEPPDSTDTLTDLPSPQLTTKLPLRRRVERGPLRAGRPAGAVDSDNSEIEEGEIVGVVDRDGLKKRLNEEAPPPGSPKISFFASKPERILRVLDGDGFVSVCAEGNWEEEREDEPVVGVEDLRRKLVSRRKERYLSFPASSPPSPQQPRPPPSPATPPAEQPSKSHKASKSAKEPDRQKSKERKTGDKETKRKKRRKGKEGDRNRSKDKEQGGKAGKEVKARRSSRSSSRKRKRRRQSTPEASHSCNSSRKGGHSRRSFSSLSEDRHRERERDKDKARDKGRDRSRDRSRDKDRSRDRDKGRERGEREHRSSSSRRRNDGTRDSRPRKRDKKEKPHSSSRERPAAQSAKRSRERRDGNRDRHHDRERRCDGRPVVPPSIQDLNGADLFAIKRTITVTTTTTTVPGSPRHAPPSPCRIAEVADPHKRKKRKWRSSVDVEDHRRSRSCSPPLSPPRYHGYGSDRYSDKLEIDVLSLDGEALDSDYPSLEDTPPAALPPEPHIPSPKPKSAPKTGQNRSKKKSRILKKSESSSSRTTGKCLSSLTVTSGSASASPALPSVKRPRKLGKEKGRDNSRKDPSRPGKSKKETGGSRKGKLQSKVSVLVREGVSSTTGAGVGSGKLSMDLLGPGGAGGGAGGSVVGGSIAVVFCRDNESRSPFLKPCSEPLSLGGRSKDLTGLAKRSGLAGPPSSLTGPAGLKPKKTKPSSITSTSSSASSPSSSLATKRRRRLAKKVKEKSGAIGSTAEDGSQSKPPPEGWGGASFDGQSVAKESGSKTVSPHTGHTGPAPSSSSSTSSSTSVLPPSSSPPHSPPSSAAPLRDTRESSPDSQTVDSSCKTPEPSFLGEDGPARSSPTPAPASPSSLSTPQGAGITNVLTTPTAKHQPPDDTPKSVASPPSSSSSAGGGLNSLSLPLSSSDPSSSSSVSSSSASKPPPPPPPPPLTASSLPWSLQTGVDCTTGGVLALTALLFKMEEANLASRAKAQEFIQATSQILSQANQSQAQQLAPPPSAQIPPPPGLSPTQFILHSSRPLAGCTKTPPPHLHASITAGCAQTPPSIMPGGLLGVTGGSSDAAWENESKDPDKYLKKLHTQERAVEEVKLAIKPYYQRKDINKDEYKDILRKAVHKICHSRTGEINPVKVSNLVKLYVQRYKYFRKHGRRMDDEEREERESGGLHPST
ncbi:splicing factor, arginine/serine-rich 19 [Oryzias latipes]|uniref:SR-related CTD-associated factor 1 n=1 Tax=Oryzias latipes TaxID=8090 RepID=A0A3B3HG05_ORYLA|nr:splicing factor, arginine/serine-rich 19 [Oryzias latipes]